VARGEGLWDKPSPGLQPSEKSHGVTGGEVKKESTELARVIVYGVFSGGGDIRVCMWGQKKVQKYKISDILTKVGEQAVFHGEEEF